MRRNIGKLCKVIIIMVVMLQGFLSSNPIVATVANQMEYQNVFNKNSTDNWRKALSYDGKKLSNASNYANMFTTHKIDVQQGDTLTWGLFGKDQYVMELYDEYDRFVRRVFSTELQIEEEQTTVIGVGNKSYTEVKASYQIQDASCAYARILGNISTMDSFMVFINLKDGLSGWPQSYIPYEKIEDSGNPLLHKSALFVGDSIVNAVKDPQKPYYGWAGRIGTSNDMDWKNAGISSATVSLALPNSYKENRIVNQLKEHKNKAYEYVILQGGMNDSIVEREIGDISGSYRLEDFDIETFSGAMEELLYTAVHDYKQAKIGYIATYATPNSTWGGKSADNAAYFRRAKELCEKWNVPYIDLFEGGIEVDGVYHSYSFDILKMRSGENLYGGDPSEIHIGSKGYDVISPYIAEWMKTLQAYENVPMEVHKGVLAEIIKKTQGAIDNEAAYLNNEDWNKFKEAFETAMKIYANEKATQAEVNQAVLTLTSSYTNIRLLPDEALLRQLAHFIEVVNTINRTFYHAGNLAYIDESCAKAKTMLVNKAFSDAEFKTFEQEMGKVLAIIANEKIQPDGDENPDHVEDTSVHKNQTVTVSPTTSDYTNLVIYYIGALGSLCMYFVIKRKFSTNKESQ